MMVSKRLPIAFNALLTYEIFMVSFASEAIEKAYLCKSRRAHSFKLLTQNVAALHQTYRPRTERPEPTIQRVMSQLHEGLDSGNRRVRYFIIPLDELRSLLKSLELLVSSFRMSVKRLEFLRSELI
jgi:hypothetical protein